MTVTMTAAPLTLVEPVLDERQLMDLLYRGIEPSSVTTNMDVSNYNHFCKLFDIDHTPITPRKPFTGTLEQYVEQCTGIDGWHMPDQWKNLNIFEFLAHKCETKEQAERLVLEWDIFEQRGLIPLLKFLVYLVATMRKHNIVWGVGRGSSVASYILFLIGVHKIDSIKYDLDIKEFLK